MPKKRIAFLNTHPIQYFAPLYAYLNASEGLAVSALYLSDYSIRGAADRAFGRIVKWDVDLLAGYDARFLPGAQQRAEPQGFFSMVVPQLWHEIRHGKFDALIVHGHAPAAMLIGVAAAKSANIPVFMRGETHLGLRRSAVKAALRRPLLSALYGQMDGVLAIGSANAEFYRRMGVAQNRIFSVPYTVDNARFIAKSRLTPAERSDLRAKLGVQDERPILLYAAKFQRRKRPQDLIRAAALLNREGAPYTLVMVGSGEMEAELCALASELGVNNIHFHGFANQSELPRIYAACDVFVLPSEDEPWGLAVNEVMCANLPVVASREIGCVADLVQDGLNGRTFAAGDVEGLADAIRPLLHDRELRDRMAAEGRKIISHWSYAECQSGIAAALASLDRATKS